VTKVIKMICSGFAFVLPIIGTYHLDLGRTRNGSSKQKSPLSGASLRLGYGENIHHKAATNAANVLRSILILTRISIETYHLSESGPVIKHRAFLLIVARGNVKEGWVHLTPATGKRLRCFYSTFMCGIFLFRLKLSAPAAEHTPNLFIAESTDNGLTATPDAFFSHSNPGIHVSNPCPVSS
jgi:hypothetical protein